MEIFFPDQQHIVYEIRLIAIREVSPPFGEEHRGLEQDLSFPANINKHLLILGKCYAVHINVSSLTNESVHRKKQHTRGINTIP